MSVVLTGTGNVSLSHPMFALSSYQSSSNNNNNNSTNNRDNDNTNNNDYNSDTIFVVIATTHTGAHMLKQHNSAFITQHGWPSHCAVEIVDENNSSSDNSNNVDFAKLLRVLREKYNVQFLDITAGGRTISSLIQQHLVSFCLSALFFAFSRRFSLSTVLAICLGNFFIFLLFSCMRVIYFLWFLHCTA